ncbi:diadenylate cyclase CdaA [Vagococcus xieshaowenii]|uniref:Diadenylate cyclase n=1 Tax=Vagococcus xieshaowenii TaxID=2562451 RepID=A0AAJ5EFN1_9ENTE|nr:diadenylate cyclase CdaA [Vagococcus xieshaowenii]QCA29056.1 TIGR00159 family protein [Vagococcus xieshaowenii]TFZ40968.1 TIGR00159 family protein [Vagococcus xieshaowenii]
MVDFLLLSTFENMKDILSQYLFSKNFIVSAIDIAVVWYFIYKLLQIIRGTKAIQVIKGIVVIIVIRVLSGILGLNTVEWVMNQVITYGVIATIIIFQPEVRRGLEHLGRGALFSRKKYGNEMDTQEMINQFNQAIKYMSKRKIGALMTIQKQTGLDDYIETGIPLNSEISGELLINIFIPNTPLHDGAVIIKDNKIAVACAYLPLSENDAIPKEFGTRHRAAIGVSEVSDAVTIVVSEETGDVSITRNGRLHAHLSEEEYLDILKEELVVTEDATSDNFIKIIADLFKKEGK